MGLAFALKIIVSATRSPLSPIRSSEAGHVDFDLDLDLAVDIDVDVDVDVDAKEIVSIWMLKVCRAGALKSQIPELFSGSEASSVKFAGNPRDLGAQSLPSWSPEIADSNTV